MLWGPGQHLLLQHLCVLEDGASVRFCTEATVRPRHSKFHKYKLLLEINVELDQKIKDLKPKVEQISLHIFTTPNVDPCIPTKDTNKGPVLVGNTHTFLVNPPVSRIRRCKQSSRRG